MATNFPTSLDNLTNPAGSDPVNNPSHASQHANLNDAIEVLETKVGINNSADTTSLDYRVKSLETTPTYTNEMAQDAVAAALAAGTHTNITINYNDTGNSISISAAAGYTNEEAVDAVAAALTAGSGISISYNDPANTITISVDSTIATKTYVDTAVSNLGSTAASTYVLDSSVGNPDGVASLDATGKIPDTEIPAGIARDSEVSSSISTAINNLINSAPGTLDTLGEIATALATSDSAAAALTTVVNGKVSKAGGDIITSSLASTIPLTLKGYTSQTANLQEWQNSAGTVLSSVNSTGLLSIGGSQLGSYSLTIRATDAIILFSPDNTSAIKSNVAYVRGNTSGMPMYLGSIGDAAQGVAAITTTSGAGSTSITSFGVNGNIITNLQSASAIGLIIKGAASQTADLQQWQNSAGTVYASISPYGQLSIGLSPTIYGNSRISINTVAATAVGQVIRGVASQTANLQEWQNSAGTVLASIGETGKFYVASTSTTAPSAEFVINSSNPYPAFLVRTAGGSWINYVSANGTTMYNNTLIAANLATQIPLTVKGAASQTANLQEWQNSAGTVLAAIEPTGSFYGSSITSYGILTSNSSFRVNNASASTVAAIIKGAASQTADLQQWQNSTGTAIAKVDASGAMFTITPADSTNSTQVATTAYVKSNINNLINSAPGALDTLNELAAALGNDASFSTTITNSLALKAPLASPTFTGTPTAPTAAAGTNTTQLATTAFVKTELSTSIQPGALYQTSAPSSPAVGQIWIDSDEDVTTFDSNILRRKAITATAGQTVFTADLPFIDGFEQIFMNGLLLVKTTDYATSGGNTVTLTSAAAASDIIEIVSVTGANSVSTYTQAETDALLAANTSVAPLSISANTTLVAKKRYFVTSASALTLTLPASPALNDEIQIVDASGNASTYNITVARNANKINGGTGNLIIDNNGGWYTLLYTGSTYGWKVG